MSELFSAHTTWSGYSFMLRTWKIYDFHLKHSSTSSKTISFSSYPATLNSVDDFYITSAGLSVIETTNGILNPALYKLITPESVLTWIRTMVSNRMASDGQEWTQIFAQYNSGTYNNQWMVTNYNVFSSGKQIQPGTLWILEQIPGYTESADVTDIVLSQGYWPSYNIPYFPDIFNISGFETYVQKYGNGFSYSECPRAQIFARDQSNVNSMGHMKWIMRYNDWQNDPLSLGDPGNAISSRFDLEVEGACTCGGIDSKVTSDTWIKKMKATGIDGPTYYEQPVFQWTAQFSSTPHYAQPNVFNFDWEIFQWE